MLALVKAISFGFRLSLLTIHSRHDESDLCGIRRACEMRVDLFRLRLVQRHESIENVVASGSIIRSSCSSLRMTVHGRNLPRTRGNDEMWSRTFIVREIILHRAHWKLFLKSVDLVQEQDDASLDKPPRVANAVE